MFVPKTKQYGTSRETQLFNSLPSLVSFHLNGNIKAFYLESDAVLFLYSTTQVTPIHSVFTCLHLMISPSVTDGLSAGDAFVTCDLACGATPQGFRAAQPSLGSLVPISQSSTSFPFLPSDLVFPAGFCLFLPLLRMSARDFLPEVVGAIAHLFLTERQYTHTHTKKRAD